MGRGKRPKRALVAVAHKLLRRMMGRLKAFYREKGCGRAFLTGLMVSSPL
jgi:hypothetical protein